MPPPFPGCSLLTPPPSLSWPAYYETEQRNIAQEDEDEYVSEGDDDDDGDLISDEKLARAPRSSCSQCCGACALTLPLACRPVQEAINCYVCGRADDEDNFILCDTCDGGAHCKCIGLEAPPRAAPPAAALGTPAG